MKPVVLVILDGFGIGPKTPANPLAKTELPTLEMIARTYPSTLLQASGIAVGLLWGEQGNSEAGHLTLGTGRPIYQYLPRIILAIRNGSFFTNPVLTSAARHAKTKGTRLHLMGLVSSGAVHSYIDHLYALLELAKREGLAPHQVVVHIFTDGRDAPPIEGKKVVAQLARRLAGERLGVIGSIMGRFYAMNRNQNWERTEAAYELLTQEKGELIKSPVQYLEASYKMGITDEFIKPALLASQDPDHPHPLSIGDGDAAIFFNYREDSARQLTNAFTEEDFAHFPRHRATNFLFSTLTQYERGSTAQAAFPPPHVTNSLGEILSRNGVRQFRIAETEKYAHITYFFNGLLEKPFDGEERILVQTPEAAHYDEHPEMGAEKLTRTLAEKISSGLYGFLLANFANVDMVAHSGNYEAAIKAAQVLDRSLATVLEAVEKQNGTLIVTADHGHVEDMRDLVTGEERTEHTTNPVPFYLAGNEYRKKRPVSRLDTLFLTKDKEITGYLADVAPTILELLGITKPEEMTGKSLLPLLLTRM